MKKITNSKGDMRGMHMKGRHLSEETKRKISENSPKIWLGKKHTPEMIKKNSEWHKNAIGEKSPAWKGEKTGTVAKHLWLIRRYGSPKYCEHCKRTDKKKYEWANKDHTYSRDIKDYIRLCTSCHRKYDLKFNNYLIKGKYGKKL